MSNKQDITSSVGNIHVINKVKSFITDNLQQIGFTLIDGPEVETEKNNFDLLNIKASHPARQMHDTFYTDIKNILLRTHTSSVQVRAMLKEQPPFAHISAGKVYRKDDDATHLPMFQQIEGILIDDDVNFSNLKDLIYLILESIFGTDVELRFRPSYFPFTEPSAEVDIRSSDGSWLEILGCGIINPVVLDNCGINSSMHSGLAFGIGVERVAMLLHHVTDIRDFYKSNLDFLEQF